jgi:hypothetical protein
MSAARTRALRALLAAGIAALSASDARAEKRKPLPEPEVSLSVATAQVVERQVGQLGFVSGRALTGGADGALDVVFALDGSEETAYGAGVDVNGDGEIAGGGTRLGKLLGSRAKGGADSILAAQVKAVETLLSDMDERATRIGVVIFAGGAAASADNAWAPVELGSRYTRVRQQLRELLDVYAPGGAADLPAGLRAARLELREGTPAERCCPQQRIVLVADGYPASARESALATEQRAITLARRLRDDRIRVDVYAVGPLATQRPRAATKVAEYSGGSFVPVEKPGDLLNVLPQIDFAEIAELRIVNVGSGARAIEQVQYPDGGFSALVPLQEGENEIEVYARATNGAEKSVRVKIRGPGRELSEREQLDLERFDRSLERQRELRIETDDPKK